MSTSQQRTAGGAFLLILVVVGGLVVLGWAFRALVAAMAILSKVLFGMGGLVALGLLILIFYRRRSGGQK